MSNKRLRGLLSGHQKMLLTDPETEELAPGVEGVRVELKSTQRAFEDAIEEETGQRYMTVAQDGALDLIVKTFADELFNACGRKRTASRFH